MVLTTEAGPRHLDTHRVLEERVDQALDLLRHGRREEQGLPPRWEQLADALDVGNEPHVEHAVGLVDDEDLHSGEQDLAAPEVIEQAAGVAISTSTPRSSLFSWSSNETPPISSARLSL
jgi:hypothetical protein